MIEDSPDGFISRWREHAAPVTVFPRVEGVPLIEFEIAGAILQALERTGPYLVRPGAGRAVVNIHTRSVEVLPAQMRHLEAPGVGQAKGAGVVTRREDPFLVVDVGAPLLVSVEGVIDPTVVEGTTVAFEAVPPVHWFGIETTRVVVAASPDEAP